jgi:hypothetical protein
MSAAVIPIRSTWLLAACPATGDDLATAAGAARKFCLLIIGMYPCWDRFLTPPHLAAAQHAWNSG